MSRSQCPFVYFLSLNFFASHFLMFHGTLFPGTLIEVDRLNAVLFSMCFSSLKTLNSSKNDRLVCWSLWLFKGQLPGGSLVPRAAETSHLVLLHGARLATRGHFLERRTSRKVRKTLFFVFYAARSTLKVIFCRAGVHSQSSSERWNLKRKCQITKRRTSVWRKISIESYRPCVFGCVGIRDLF